ncbi:MAG: PAS domain-containing protein [Rhodothermaceae bacterium]|nr:PAS domain-containing protein [Rhodothermaceae bacterium]
MTRRAAAPVFLDTDVSARPDAASDPPDRAAVLDEGALEDGRVQPVLPFPVVGIGASAGGLNALGRFFDALPDEPGMAFIIVQHLSPNHTSELAHLLQAHTSLNVTQVTGSTEVHPNHVYVIPPGKSLTLDDGRLELADSEPLPGFRSPIDLLLRSLAAEQGARAVGIVLSGTGSDGTLGLKAIKEHAGLTLAQEPEDAEYDSMPARAIGTGLVDVVAPADELAHRLSDIEHLAATHPLITAVDDLATNDEEALGRIFALLRSRAGHDFSHYKRSTILRRLARRLHVNQFEELSAYLAYLRTDTEESDALFRDLLISVTHFFRDPAAFRTLEHDVLPRLFEGKETGDPMRVWVPGCATGEEAYSLAMLLSEYAGCLQGAPDFQLFATDLDNKAVAFAREALYPHTIAAEISPDRLQRFFQPEAEGYRVRRDLRERLLFAPHNLLEHPPFSKLDLISCRNLLIYLQRSVQDQLFELFHYALRPGGFLFLGTSESADRAAPLFRAFDKTHRLYCRQDVTPTSPTRLNLDRSPFPPSLFADQTPVPTQPLRERSLTAQYDAWTLARHAPPRLLVNRQGDIVYVFGEAGRYLVQREGPVTQNVLQRIRDGLQIDLRTALFRAIEHRESTDSRVRRVEVEGSERAVRLHVGPIEAEEFPEGFAEIVFIEYDAEVLDVIGVQPTDGEAGHPLLGRLEEELQETRDRLQSTIEEQETSNEELRISNEELQVVNQELLSTTEELETSKEELQSINEELSTVNQELKTKIEELDRANADLQNLMAATEIATLFLDHDLRLQRFTPRTADLFHVLPSDVGRPFEHLTHRLNHGTLPDLARHVLDSLELVQEETQTKDGRWFQLRMFPYLTHEDRIGGVVLTLVEITRLKEAEATTAAYAAQQAAIAELGLLAVETTDLDLLFDTACRRVSTVLENEFCKVLELDPDGTHLRLRNGVGWKDGIVGEARVPNDPGSQAGYTLLASGPVLVEDVAHEERFTAPALLRDHAVVSGMSTPIFSPDGPWGVLGTHDTRARSFTDDDARFLQAIAYVLGESIQRHHNETALQERVAVLDAVIESMPEAVYIGNGTTIQQCNHAALDLIGAASLDDLQGHSAELAQKFNVRDPETGEPVPPGSTPFARALAGEVAVAELLARKASTGQEVFLRASAAPIRLHGEIIGAVGVHTDLTERRQIEQTLAQNAVTIRAQLQEIEAIYSRAPVGMALNDRDLRFRRINGRLAAINGPTVEEHLGKTVREVLPELADQIEPIYQSVLDTGNPIHDLEIRGTTTADPDQENIWLCSYVPQFDEGGEVIGVNVVVRDVTTQRRAEEALAESRKDLAAEQARLEAILQQLPIGVMIAEPPDTTLVFSNDAAAHLVEDTVEWETHGAAFDRWILRDLDGKVYPPERLPIRRALYESEIVRGENVTFSRPDGSPLYIRLYAGPIRNAEGEIVAGVVAFDDVSQEMEARESLRALAATLEERVAKRTAQARALATALTVAEQQERSRIAQVLHDDLQQILYGLRLKLQALLKDVRRADSERAQAEHEAAIGHLERSDTLLVEALHTTRTLTLDLKPPIFSGEGLDATLTWLAQHMTDTYDLAVTLHLEEPTSHPPPHLHALVFQIVRELLFNIIKHAGVNAADVYVKAPQHRFFSVVVEDHGVGFDPSLLSESLGGFGLVSVRERLSLFGGDLDIWSDPTAGTRITLTLPLQASTEPPTT